jgi:hypothetical protein
MAEFCVKRDFFASAQEGKEGFCLGEFYANGNRIAYTVEDEDRHLELPGTEKVYGKTAIPRGRYQLVVDFSHRFQKTLPHILNVPGYEGIRIHGGNRAEDSLGCILVGLSRTKDGVSNCAPAVRRIIELIQVDEDVGIKSWITIE